TDAEMVVAVSPAGKSLRIAGTTGLVLGGSIDAVVNDKYRKAIREALQGYDTGKVFEERIEARLNQALSGGIKRVAPMGSTAGFNSDREAEQMRYQKLGADGVDLLLDLTMTYGVYGYEGTMVAKLEGKLRSIPKGSRQWDETVVASPGPILASARLGDPTNRLSPAMSGARLSVEDEAVGRWTSDGGALLRQDFEAAVDGAISALLCDLGLAEEALGEYNLGKRELNAKHFAEAASHFRKAIALDNALAHAHNGLAVTLAHADKLDEAIAMTIALTERSPDYAPAWYNLAWWHATEKKDPNAAKPYYERARALGMAQDEKIEKALKK
ncbi:MAG: tetratricopeptide repeat protein, partial [Candidatus Hydrogenedentes bacterium]|nr:tetratricopeptide repeat protein [Candidatus Hydrogenedentota bacterium]